MSVGKHVSFRMDDNVDVIIRDYAKFMNMSISEVIRQAVVTYIEDDMDARYFHQAVQWEKVSRRLESVKEMYGWLGIDSPKY